MLPAVRVWVLIGAPVPPLTVTVTPPRGAPLGDDTMPDTWPAPPGMATETLMSDWPGPRSSATVWVPYPCLVNVSRYVAGVARLGMANCPTAPVVGVALVTVWPL